MAKEKARDDIPKEVVGNEYQSSFLKFDRHSSMLGNFIKNFWNQFKNPTRFGLLRMTFENYKQNKQAIRNLSEGKQTDSVKKFLERYEIRPRNSNSAIASTRR